MINSQTNYNGGVNVLPANDKQSSTATKKTALRDVQNQNSSFLGSHQVAPKVCGTKRLTPEHPSQLSLSNNAVSEHIVNARRRFELELGRGRIYNTIDKYADCSQSRQNCQLQPEIPPRQTQLRESDNTRVPVATSNNLTSTTNFSYGGPSVPNHVGKHGTNMQGADLHKVSAEVQHPISSKSTVEQRMTERFIRLQNFLKQCDESYQRDYIQMLLHLSPPELSRHAVELEKRAIQLTIEEGKEMQRMKSLNILTKSAPANHTVQTTQLHQLRN